MGFWRTAGFAAVAVVALWMDSVAASDNIDGSLDSSLAFQDIPQVVLGSVEFNITISLPPYAPSLAETEASELVVVGSASLGVNWPETVAYSLYLEDGTALDSGSLSIISTNNNGDWEMLLDHSVALQVPHYGDNHVWVEITHMHGEAPTFTCLVADTHVYAVPGVLCLVPAFVTLVITLVFKQVILALSFGVYSGFVIIAHYNPVVGFQKFWSMGLTNAIANDNNTRIILFSLLLGGQIAVIQKGGGALGLAGVVRKFIKSSRSALLAVFAAGIMVFFDDYSSILIAGSALRLTVASFGVSTEKLSSLLHNTGVAVASMAPISSWAGVQLGGIIASYAASGVEVNAFALLIRSLPHRFFPIFSLLATGLTCYWQRDFPRLAEAERESYALHEAEETARKLHHHHHEGPAADYDGVVTVGEYPLLSQVGTQNTLNSSERESDSEDEDHGDGPLDPVAGTPIRWVNAVLPFSTLLAVTVGGMLWTGYQALVDSGKPFGFASAFSGGDAVDSLLWGSALALCVAMAMMLSQKILTLETTMSVFWLGVQDIIEPTAILILAWGLGSVIKLLYTPGFVMTLLGSSVPASLLPGVVTLLVYGLSFAAGSAFATMSIAFFLVVPLAAKIGGEETMFLCVCSILSGVVFGNSSSPVADTTAVASLAAHADITRHIDTHIWVPALPATVALVCSFLTGLGVPGWICLLVGCVVVTCVLYLVTVPTNVPPHTPIPSLPKRMSSNFHGLFRKKKSLDVGSESAGAPLLP